jgi:cytochrome c oxidase cbb3-type subunit 4
MNFDLNDLRSLVTLLSFGLFAAIAAWAWRPANRARFDDDAMLPFADEAPHDSRAERRAAPSRPALPSGDGATYSSREGLQCDPRAERRAAPSRPALPSGDGATYSSREGLQ